MRLKAITGIALTMLLFVVVSPIGVSVEVVDFESESGDFMAQSSVDWWPMFHHDLRNTGYSTSTAPDTNDTIWTYTTGDWVVSSPAVVNGRVYVGSDDCKVYCLDASTGDFVWSSTTGSRPYFSSPAVAYGRVYVGADNYYFYCLDAVTGDKIWSEKIYCMVDSSAAVADGKVYTVQYSEHIVHCLDAFNGTRIWNYTTAGPSWLIGCPAVADGKVYVGAAEGRVYCLDASTGTHIWNFSEPGRKMHEPAVVDGRVYVASYYGAHPGEGRVYCLDASTGTHIWNYTTGGWMGGCPAVAYGRVYAGSADDNLYCLDASTGAKIWNYTTDPVNYFSSSPAVADGKVYVGSDDHKVYCLDASTGDFVWSYTTGSLVRSSPAVADGKVYVGSYDGKIYAFGPPYDAMIEAYCYTEASPVSVGITMDGSPTGYTTPHTFTGLIGTHNFTVPDTDPSGHPFKQWGTGETSTTVTVATAGTYTAYYATKYNLTITENTGGTTNPADGTYTYWDGTIVDVTAIPALGYLLDYWELDGDDVGTANPISVTMDMNHMLHAVFSWVGTYDLTITVTAGGTTSPAPGTYPFTIGTVATVRAEPSVLHDFDYWKLDGTTFGFENPIDVTMDSNHILEAIFKRLRLGGNRVCGPFRKLR